jgi:hypothetical protein
MTTSSEEMDGSHSSMADLARCHRKLKGGLMKRLCTFFVVLMIALLPAACGQGNGPAQKGLPDSAAREFFEAVITSDAKTLAQVTCAGIQEEDLVVSVAMARGQGEVYETPPFFDPSQIEYAVVEEGDDQALVRITGVIPTGADPVIIAGMRSSGILEVREEDFRQLIDATVRMVMEDGRWKVCSPLE